MMSQDKKPLFYLHVHKCGGSSIRNLMHAHIPLGTLFPSDLYLRNEEKKIPFDETGRVLFEEERSLSAQFTAAHMNFYEVSRPERWHWVTVLRHPVDRVISDFFHKIWQARNGNPYFSGMENLTWEIYLSYIGQGQANNHICRMLVGPDWPEDSNPEQAVEMLNHFSVVGILENPKRGNQFVADYVSDYLEVPRQLVPRSNTNPLATREVSQKIRDRIMEQNKGDLRLYEAAKKRVQG